MPSPNSNTSTLESPPTCETSVGALCQHCGNVVPENREGFCCRGCEVVYRVIHDIGLGHYYTLPRESSEAADVPSDYSYFDDPLFLERFTQTLSPSQSRVTFFLPGIHCAACIWLLERLPQVLPGIVTSRVDFSKNTVVIVYDTQTKSLSEIGQFLASIGYPPLPTRDSDLERQRLSIQRQAIVRLGVAGVCLMNIMMLAVSLYEGDSSGIAPRYLSLFSWISLVLALPPILYCAQPFYRAALGGLRAGILHIDVPISIALIAGFLVSVVNVVRGSSEIYFDSIAAVIFLLLAGRMFQQRTVSKVLDSMNLLTAFTPQSARRVKNGVGELVYIGSISPGEIVAVSSGQIIPADGMLLSRQAEINNAVITGESEPEQVIQGARLFTGASNIGPELLMRVDAIGADSRLGAILAQVQTGARLKAPIEGFLDVLGRRFTALVLLGATGTFALWYSSGISVAVNRVIALLIVSCPCAIALATPLAFAVAVGRAARSGFLLKGAEIIERSSKVEVVLFDKTGTLTEGQPQIREVVWQIGSSPYEQEVRSALSALEAGIEHPVAKLITRWARSSPAVELQREVFPGRGVAGIGKQGVSWDVGSLSWLRERGVAVPPEVLERTASFVGVARNRELLLAIFYGDSIREESAEVVAALNSSGIEVEILSGDRCSVVSEVAREVNLPEMRAHGELSPEDKADRVRERGSKQMVAMVGDGVNDVLALHAAHVGIGVSGGAEACLRTADVYISTLGIAPILDLFDGCKRTMRVVRRNLVFSAMYNVVGSMLAIMGYIGPLEAAILMPLSSLTVVLNSTFGRTFCERAQE